MLLGLRLKNFKRYRDQTIDLSPPIILLVGPNSSGKSSILKPLLAFKQTYEDQGDHTGFLSKGDYVDVGPFVEYVRNHNRRTKCGFEFLVRLTGLRPTTASRSLTSLAIIDVSHELDPQTGHGRLAEYTIYPLLDRNASHFWTSTRPLPHSIVISVCKNLTSRIVWLCQRQCTRLFGLSLKTGGSTYRRVAVRFHLLNGFHRFSEQVTYRLGGVQNTE